MDESEEVGNAATFTILQENPFKIDPTGIKDIPVVGIVYRGAVKLNDNKGEVGK